MKSAGYQDKADRRLLALHHRPEEKVIHYLTWPRLLKISGKQVISKVFRKKDADVPMGNL